MAKSTTVKVEVRGLSSHCGEPEKGHDALLAACRFIDSLYSYKDKHVRKRSILKFGKMKSGNVLNAISDYSRIDGTMRTFEKSTWKKLVNAMKHYAKQMSGRYNVDFKIDVSKFHPAVVNDENLYNRIKPTLLNDHINFVELRRPVMIAEDFSFFEEVMPGIFFFLGTGTGTPLHSSDFNFDEDVLVEGVHLFNTIFTKL